MNVTDSELPFRGATKRMRLVLQTEAAECSLACLAMIASYHGHEADLVSLRRRFHTSSRGITLARAVEIADQLGFETRALRTETDFLSHVDTPCILHWDLNHFVVLGGVKRGRLDIFDPGRGRYSLSLAEVGKHFTGVILELRPGQSFQRVRAPASVSVRRLMGTVSGIVPLASQVLAIAVCVEVLALALPFQLQWILDTVLVGGDTRLLIMSTLAFLLLLFAQAGLSLCRSWLVSWAGASITSQWITNLFAHLLRLPIEFFERRHIGDIVSRFASIQAIQTTISSAFVDAVLSGMMGSAALCIMLIYSIPMTMVVVATTALYGTLRWASYGLLWRVNEEQLVFSARQQTELMESVRGAQIIKLAGMQAYRKARLSNATVEMAGRSIKAQRFAAIFATANQAIFGAQRILLMGVGAYFALKQYFSAGMLIAFVAYADQFAAKVSLLIDKAVEFRMLGLHAQRIADIALAEGEEAGDTFNVKANGDAAGLTLEGIGFRYSEADPWVLRHVSFTIEPGESVAIVGPSGCGKTTLAKLLVGLSYPTEGTLRIDGHAVTRRELAASRRRFGVVMQDDTLFAGSIADNIAFFDPGAQQADVENAARLARIHDDIKRMPMGYETLVGDMGSTLSGGQRQRIILARALYRRPALLLLDEATSHLDIDNERRINEAIAGMKMTRIIIAHRPETIASADRIIDLSKQQEQIYAEDRVAAYAEKP